MDGFGSSGWWIRPVIASLVLLVSIFVGPHVPFSTLYSSHDGPVSRSQERFEQVGGYRAAVVEHMTITYPRSMYEDGKMNPSRFSLASRCQSARGLLEANLFSYEKAIGEASRRGVHILVFPEDGLFGFKFISREEIHPFLQQVPHAGEIPSEVNSSEEEGNSDCDTNYLSRRFSTWSRSYRLYIVVNFGTMLPCSKVEKENGENTASDCPEDGRWQFNSNLVFGLQGEVVSVYHKMRLFHEVQFDTPPLSVQSSGVTFSTSFGVKFGFLTCFDILFHEPTKRLYEEGIRHFVFPTGWINAPPLLSSTQFHNSWSRTFSSVLLSSNQGGSLPGMTGSGIFSNGTAIVRHFLKNEIPRPDFLLIADIQLDGQALSVQEFPHPIALVSNSKRADEPLISDMLASAFAAKGIDQDLVRSMLFGDPDTISVPLDGSKYDIEPQFALHYSTDAGIEQPIFLAVEHGRITCRAKFSLNSTLPPDRLIALAAFDGMYRDYFAIQVCALVTCRVQESTSGRISQDSCFHSGFDPHIPIRKAQLVGEFSHDYEIFPSVLRSSGEELDANRVHVESSHVSTSSPSSVRIQIDSNLDSLVHDFRSMSLYGRKMDP